MELQRSERTRTSGSNTNTLLVTAHQPAVRQIEAAKRVPPVRWLRGHPRDLAALAVLLVVLAVLWGRAATTWFWIDEAIAVGVASHPLSQLPTLLGQDGSPPLYYVLLHAWMSLFGSSEIATHLLSLVFALAAVPAALWAGWSLFGRRTGWICATLTAISPFIGYYANETRMYTLVLLLTFLVTATFVHAFVFRRRGYLPAFAVLLALLMYTHDWGLLVALGATVALGPCLLVATDRRRLIVDGTLALGAAAVLYAPWAPTLLYQVLQHEQPWATHVGLTTARDDIATAFGGYYVLVSLGLTAAASVLTVFSWPLSRQSLAITVAGVIPLVAIVAGWATSIWAPRYLAAVVPELLLFLALTLAGGGRIAMAGVIVAALLAAPLGVFPAQYSKSNLNEVAQTMSPTLQAGDLVVSPDYTQIPLLSYYFRPGLRYAGTEGLVPDIAVADWRNGLDRVRHADPALTLPPLLDQIPVGGHVVLMCPIIKQSPGLVEFHQIILQRCQQIQRMLSADQRFHLYLSLNPPSRTDVKLTPWRGQELTRMT